MAGARQFDEDQLLARVLETFWTRGWQHTSMAHLSEAGGVQRGSLYHAYGSKEELFLLAFERYATGFLTRARTALSAPTPRRALTTFFDVAIANMTAGSPPRGCLTTKTMAEADEVGDRIRTRLQHLVDQLQVTIRDALSVPGVRDHLATSPDAAAQVLVTFTRGLAVMERLNHDADSLRRSAEVLVDLLLKPDPED